MGWPKGVPHSREHNEKIRKGGKKAWKARPHKRPEEFREKVSEAMKEYYKTHPHPRLGKKHSEKTKKRWSRIRKGVKQPPDLVKRRTEGIQRYWKNEENRKRVSEEKKKWFSEEGAGRSFRGRATRILYLKKQLPQEVLVMEQLRTKRIRYVHQKMIDGRYVVDIYVPRYNGVIECDYQVRKGPTEKRDAVLLKEVRSVVHLLYKEIEADPKAATERALRCLKP